MHGSVFSRRTWRNCLASMFTAAIIGAVPSIVNASDGTVPVTIVPVDGEPVAIRQWLLAGPFPSPDLAVRVSGGPTRAGFDMDYLAPIGGETNARPVDGTEVPLPDGGSLSFALAEWDDDYINLVHPYGMLDEMLAYLYCEVESPVEQEAYIHVGTNDAGKFWVDGELVVRYPFDRGAMKSQNAAKITLRAGRTPILAKIDQAVANWGMYAEIYGKTAHERVLEAASPEAMRTAAQALASALGGADPVTLTGHRRNAYAFGLYCLQRLERDVPMEGNDQPEWRRELFDVPRYVSLLTDAADAMQTGRNLYEGKTGTFEAVYLSDVDGTAQPMTLSIPASFDPNRKYMLLIDLHGASGTHEQTEHWWRSYSTLDSAYHDQTIALAAMGRGRWSGYTGLGEDDVLRAMDWVIEHYPIDIDRVYISGSSMGGGGSWRIASRYPDRFAAAWPECGWPDWPVLENTSNLPVYLNHGNADWVVAVTNTHLGANRLSELGYPVVYREIDGVGHGVGFAARKGGWMSRLAPHARVVDPPSVRITADHPRNSAMYWAGIDRWIDPHELAQLSVRILPDNVVAVNVSNVARAHMTPPAPHLSEAGDLVWIVNGSRVVTGRNPGGTYEIARADVPVAAVGADSVYTVRPYVASAPPAERPYVSGAMMNLYHGEPLLIVYGTQMRKSVLADAIRSMADDAAKRLSPNRSPIEFGKVPVKADTEVTASDIATKNLLLIGGPNENAVVKRLMRALPVREERGSLRVFDEKPVSLDGRGYAFVHRNPEAPQRLIAVYASAVPQFYTFRRSALMSWQAEEYTYRMADIAIEEVAQVDSANAPQWNKIVKQYRFTHDWKLKQEPRPRIGRHPANVGEAIEFTARAMIGATDADFMFHGELGNAAAEVEYVAGEVSWTDLALYVADNPIVFDVSGAELRRFASNEEAPVPWVYPAVDMTAIDDARMYRIVAPGWIVWDLARSYHWNPTGARHLNDPERYERHLRRQWQVE